MHSDFFNLAYVYAEYIEKMPEKEWDSSFKSYAEFLEENEPYNSVDEYINTFGTFKHYYGMYFKGEKI